MPHYSVKWTTVKKLFFFKNNVMNSQFVAKLFVVLSFNVIIMC